MRIARINLLFPVWKMSGTVGFSQHRRATLFEKILLDISHNFGNDPHYAGETLYDLLTRIACISECDAFVLPALTQMIDNGIITCQTPFRSLRGVRLEDLHLTEAGVAMAKAGSVAGELSEKAVELYLDPLRREILSEEDQDNLTGEPFGRTFPEPVQEADLDNLAVRHFREAPPDWLKEGDQITRVNLHKQATLWRSTFGEIRLAENAELVLDFGHADINDHFAEMAPEDLAEQYFAPAFRADGLEKLVPAGVVDLARLNPAPEQIFAPARIEEFMALENPGIHFLRYREGLEDQLTLRDNTLMVVFEYLPEDNPEGVAWDEKRNAAIVYLDERFPINGCLYLNHNRDNLFLAKVAYRLRGKTFTAPMGFVLSGNHRRLDPTPFYELVSEILDTADSSDYQLIKLFWKSPQAVFQDVYGQVKRRVRERTALMEELGEFRERIRRIRPGSTLRTIDLDP